MYFCEVSTHQLNCFVSSEILKHCLFSSYGYYNQHYYFQVTVFSDNFSLENTRVKNNKENNTLVIILFFSAATSEESLSWSISSNTDYLLDLKGRHVVHFDCQCVDFKNYKGTFSQMLSNPLSTVPLLHLRRNANVTIDVNLFHCGKLKMALDFTELLAQRSASNIDFVMKVSIDTIKLNSIYVWVEKMLNNIALVLPNIMNG